MTVPRREPLSSAADMPQQDEGKKPPMETAPEQRWKLQVFYLCFYGFMTQIRPGESFITPYLLGHDKNFTQVEVTNEITPVLKTVITIIVADKRGLGLSVHPQFYVYFSYSSLLALVYLLMAMVVIIRHSRRAQPPELIPTEGQVQEKSPEAATVQA